MTGILSLPSELLYKIIETCSGPDRCRLRATCKVLNEHANPIVFRRLAIHPFNPPHIVENLIIALATRSSKACEFTTDWEMAVPNGLQASEQSWPHFGHCDDLRVHLPTAISTLRNLTRFSFNISGFEPDELIDSLMQIAARLPHLTDLKILAWTEIRETRVQFSLFANLSRLTVFCGLQRDISFFISEVATAIANSPQLGSLDVRYMDFASDSLPLRTLSALFAKIPTNGPLRLNHLTIKSIDATVDQVTLPHLKQLTSFEFQGNVQDLSIAQNAWTGFLDNNIKLSDVDVQGCITEEMMLYLSSFSGLKTLNIHFDNTMIMEKFENMLFGAVLPKHTKSLQMLRITNAEPGEWVFNRTNSKSILNCLKLRELRVHIDGRESGMSVQLLLDTVAHLPELKVLHFDILDPPKLAYRRWVESFKPSPGLRYVEELKYFSRQYVLEKVGGRPVRYREIK